MLLQYESNIENIPAIGIAANGVIAAIGIVLNILENTPATKIMNAILL